MWRALHSASAEVCVRLSKRVKEHVPRDFVATVAVVLLSSIQEIEDTSIEEYGECKSERQWLLILGSMSGIRSEY